MQIDLENLKKMEEQLEEVTKTAPGRENAWIFLHSYFLIATPIDDKKLLLSLFRWYTDLTWRRLTTLSYDEFAKIAIGRQVPLALLLGFDVQKEMFDYLNLRCPDEESMAEVYAKAKKEFLNSEAYLGTLNGKDYVLKDIFVDIRKYNLDRQTTIEKAIITEKFTSILFPKNNELFNKYISSSPAQVIDWLIGLVNLFMGIEEDDILLVVEGYLHQAEEEMTAASKQSIKSVNVTKSPLIEKKPVVKPAAPKIIEKVPEKIQDTKIMPDQKITPPKKEEKSVRPADESLNAPKALVHPIVPNGQKKSAAATQRVRLSYKEIRQQIDSSFTKDKQGNFINVTDVINELQKISVAQEDIRIKDLYYFNEQNGGFEWNENLLKD